MGDVKLSPAQTTFPQEAFDEKLDADSNAVSASKLFTPRKIILANQFSGEELFDGSADVSISGDLVQPLVLDANAVTTVGVYHTNDSTVNLPPTLSNPWGTLLVYRPNPADTTHMAQHYIHYGASTIYKRCKLSNVWQDWDRAWDSGNMPITHQSFTPTIAGTGGGPAATYTKQIGKCQRVGNTVHVSIHLIGSFAAGMLGSMVIYGLPYASSEYFAGVISFGQGYVSDIMSRWMQVNFITSPSSTTLSFAGTNNLGAGGFLPTTDFIVGAFDIVGQCTYDI